VNVTHALRPAAHWLDILPALPLAKGVPVVDVEDQGQPRHIVVVVDADWLHLTGHDTPYQDRAFRVDLDEPQGYAYALRHLISSSRPTDIRFSSTGTATLRHWLGQTTNADRLALAQALAEVKS
jgi:hypothetical protein